MKINKLTDYAIIIISEMNHEQLISAKSISEITHVPYATVNKILRFLTKSKICQAKGGKSGGFLLIKRHAEISLLDVIQSIEGVNNFTECSLETHSCQLKNFCKLSKKMKTINDEIYSFLNKKYISDLIS